MASELNVVSLTAQEYAGITPSASTLYIVDGGESVTAYIGTIKVSSDRMTAALRASVNADVKASVTNARNAANDAETAKDAAQSAVTAIAASASSVSDDSQTAANAATASGNARNAAEVYATQAGNSASSASSSAGDALETYEQTQALHDNILEVISIPVGPVRNLSVLTLNNVLNVTWTDPDNSVNAQGATEAFWMKTRIVMKHGGYPEDETDGTAILDSTVRDQYRLMPFLYDMGSSSDCYFAIFTCTTGGVWNRADAKRWVFNVLSFATVRQCMRSNIPLSTIGLEMGAYVDTKTSQRFPAHRWLLADDNYRGCQFRDPNIDHGAIFMSRFLPCEAGSDAALQMPLDAPENEYGVTWDVVFMSGKVYYTFAGGVYTALTEGTDWTAGDSVASWVASHGTDVWSKNHASRKSNGSNNWKESNARAWMNGVGDSYWTQQNEYDVKSNNPGYATGLLSGFDADFVDLIMPVYNITARNTVSSAQGGGGGGYDTTLDTIWLPSNKEVFNTNVNGIAEGAQFYYFANIASTAASRIQYDEGGTARVCWLRSPNAGSVHNEYSISASGGSTTNIANNSSAFLFAICIA